MTATKSYETLLFNSHLRYDLESDCNYNPRYTTSPKLQCISVMVNQCFSVVYWDITHDEQSEE